VKLAPGAKRIASIGRLDLDDVGAKFGQHARRKGRGDERAEFKDA
jgi:hypothetical protein